MALRNQKCLHCSQARYCRESFLSLIFFVIGLIATVAIRAVNFLHHYHAWYGKLAWYIGLLGFFLFFLYKFASDSRRSAFLKKSGLAEKIQTGQQLSPDDRRLLQEVFCSLRSRRDTINYFFIFLTSIVALLLGIYTDFVKK